MPSTTCRVNLREQVETHSVWDDVACVATLRIANTHSPSRGGKLAQRELGLSICPQGNFHLLSNLLQRLSRTTTVQMCQFRKDETEAHLRSRFWERS